MPIRIMHVVDNLGKGGLENGLVNLIERLDANRFEHVVYAMRVLGANADRLPSDRVRIICLGKKETDGRFQVAALARAIRDIKPDIVHSRNWGAVEAILAGKWAGSCALIHSEHGLESNTALREPFRRTCIRRLAFELADRVLSVSYQLRELHAARTRFPAARISVIHNGVDRRRFFPDSETRARVRAELGLAANEFCIGCVGNLSAAKDYPTVLKAVAKLATTSKDWRLFVVGTGPERDKLEGVVNAQAELKERVTFLGLSRRVAELMQAFDVYVLSSVIEGISNSLLEAMASGLPVAVTATGGNPEVVVDGESGLLFGVGDDQKLTEHLLLLKCRDDLRLQFGQNAMQRVRDAFSIDNMVRQYDELYSGVAAHGKAALAVETA